MVWIVVVVAVVVVGFALAWWSSGRSRGGRTGFSAAGERGRADATMQAIQHRNQPPGGSGPSSF